MAEPESVLATRKIQSRGAEISQVLVKWKGQSVENTTWEDVEVIRAQFPDFSLEDKAEAAAGGIDSMVVKIARWNV